MESMQFLQKSYMCFLFYFEIVICNENYIAQFMVSNFKTQLQAMIEVLHNIVLFISGLTAVTFSLFYRSLCPLRCHKEKKNMGSIVSQLCYTK